jgi:hypothetical protein
LCRLTIPREAIQRAVTAEKESRAAEFEAKSSSII